MGALTLSQFKVELQFLMGGRTELGTALGQARMERWVQNAYRHICLPKFYHHKSLETTQDIVLSSTQPNSLYTLASDIGFIIFVRNHTTGVRYLPRKTREFLDGPSVGNNRYSRYGNGIFLRADGISGQTVRVFYYKIPTVLGTSDATALPAWWDEPLLQMAGFYGWASYGNVEMADFHRETAAAMAADNAEDDLFETNDAGWENEIEPSEPYGRAR